MTGSHHPDVMGMSGELLASAVGKCISRVQYKGAAVLSDQEGLHEIDQAVVVSVDSEDIVLEWEIGDAGAFLGVKKVSDSLTSSVLDSVDVIDRSEWVEIAASPIDGFAIATVESESGGRLLWSLRINVRSGASVVVALGELRDGHLNYRADNLLVIFSQELASSLQLSDGSESAWGRNVLVGSR
jgi:hypothetical protein